MPLPQGVGQLDLFEQRKLVSLVGGGWNLNRLGQRENPAFNDLRLALAPQKDPSSSSTPSCLSSRGDRPVHDFAARDAAV